MIAARANALLADGSAIRRRPYAEVASEINRFDYLGAYCEDLVNALNLKAVRDAVSTSAPIRWVGRACSTGATSLKTSGST